MFGFNRFSEKVGLIGRNNLIYSCLFDTCNVYYILFNNKIKFTLNNNLQNTAENTKDRATASCVIKYYRGNDILQSDSLELSA
jgi:hypothetical protein